MNDFKEEYEGSADGEGSGGTYKCGQWRFVPSLRICISQETPFRYALAVHEREFLLPHRSQSLGIRLGKGLFPHPVHSFVKGVEMNEMSPRELIEIDLETGFFQDITGLLCVFNAVFAPLSNKHAQIAGC